MNNSTNNLMEDLQLAVLAGSLVCVHEKLAEIEKKLNIRRENDDTIATKNGQFFLMFTALANISERLGRIEKKLKGDE